MAYKLIFKNLVLVFSTFFDVSFLFLLFSDFFFLLEKLKKKTKYLVFYCK